MVLFFAPEALFDDEVCWFVRKDKIDPY